MRMPSPDLLCTQKTCVAEGTVLNKVSNRTVSSENVRRLVVLVLNDSLSVHAVNITPIVKANKKSRFIIP